MIIVEQLRHSARISTAPEMNRAGLPIEKNLYWKAAEVIASLQGEVGKLADAMENLLTNHCRLVESGDCGNWDVDAEPEVAAARALLDALPSRASLSQHPGEGEKGMTPLEIAAKEHWSFSENLAWEALLPEDREHLLGVMRRALLALAEAELPPAVISDGILHAAAKMSEFPDDTTMAEARPHVAEAIFGAMLRAIAQDKPNDA